jgi:hypothetical protein
MTLLAEFVGERVTTIWPTEANDTFSNVTTFINKTLQCLVCKMHGRDKKMHKRFWFKCLNCRDHLEDLGIDGRIILI